MTTYGQVLAELERSTERLYVSVFYPTGTFEWLPVDKTEYIRQLKMMDLGSLLLPYPCYFEVDGEMFIHSKGENK